MISYQIVKNWHFPQVRYVYRDRDVMLYALAAGLGADPLDRGSLDFVYEKRLKVLPTFVTLAGAPGLWWRDPRTGADALRLVHGEQRMHFLRNLPPAGALIARNRVESLTDKGAGRGAIGVVSREVFDESTGELVARSTNISVLRGDGGFSAVDGRSDPPPAPLPAVPEREPDLTVDLSSRPEAALLYRLTGDMNPIHADPEVARAAGFDAPIMHGLCTFAMACHAVLRVELGYETARLAGMAVRFTSPVYPGETVRFELWREPAESRLRLRARVPARAVTVLDNGIMDIREVSA